jgi:hypothetical protein
VLTPFFYEKGGLKKMKEKIYTILFIILIIVMAYITVSTAARNCAIDEYKLIQWRYENAVRP